MYTSSPENLLALSGDINERRESVMRYVGLPSKRASGVVCGWWAGVVQCHSHSCYYQQVMTCDQDGRRLPQIGTRFLS